MKLEIFDPPMCCSSGVCGPSVDPRLVSIQDALRRIDRQFAALEVVRYNLNGQASAFRDNDAVMELLKQEGTEVLPIVMIDGRLVKKGDYPSYGELVGYIKASTTAKWARTELR